jgi:hypothetical protein
MKLSLIAALLLVVGVLIAPLTPIASYPAAPLCTDSGAAHDHSRFHTLWDAERGCHYDHEHGQSPFVPEVDATFPGFDLGQLLGGVEIGHTNPSSPMENHHKHGGFKWNVQLEHPQGCKGFEGAVTGVNGSVIQYHGFGNYAVELEATTHSAVALLRQCRESDPTDYGYLYVVQHVNYGQRVTPYQGTLIPYANNSLPAYATGLGPYLSVDCVGSVPQCRRDLNFIRSRNLNAFSNWTSKGGRAEGSTLFNLFFRVRDTYQVFDWNDQTHPFTYLYVCSPDNGQTYAATGCKYNNTTTQVHEIAGVIPGAWDNLGGFDTDPEVGRITAEGFVARFGTLNPACVEAGEDCHPIKMVRAFVGSYGSVLVFTPGKGTNVVPYLPERDLYFCNGQACPDTTPGAVPSGWVGTDN